MVADRSHQCSQFVVGAMLCKLKGCWRITTGVTITMGKRDKMKHSLLTTDQ